MSKISDEEWKVFKTIIYIGLGIIFLGLCLGILMQQSYIKLLQREIIILKNKQSIPSDRDNVWVPEKDPGILQDKNGRGLFTLM